MQPPATNRGGFAANAGIDARLVTAQVAIDRVLGDAQLQARMAAQGYPAKLLLQGRALRNHVLALHQKWPSMLVTNAQARRRATVTRLRYV